MTSTIVAEVVQATQALAAGLGDLVWGHASVRDPESRGAWMKASGKGFEEVSADDVVLVSPAGEILHGHGKRHVEYPIHTALLAARPDITCVVHTHVPTVNAFSALGEPLRALSHEGVLFVDPEIGRFQRTGNLISTTALGEALAETVGDGPGCLMPQHGMVTVGRTPAEAVMRSVLLERACHTHLLAASAGGPRLWSDRADVSAKRLDLWSEAQLEAGYQYLLRCAARLEFTAPAPQPLKGPA